MQLNAAQAWLGAAEARKIGGVSEKVLQKRLDHANRRFLSSIKTLAQVRRLLGPAVQVNLVDKQLNLMAAGEKAPDPMAIEPGEDG